MAMFLSPIALYVAARIISTAYFHSKKQFLKEIGNGIQV